MAQIDLKTVLSRLPESEKNHVVILSGGLDSSILTMLLQERFGSERLLALSFNYGQKQVLELARAAELTRQLKVRHEVLDLCVLGEIARPVSANISGTALEMPKIHDVLGDPQPKTYVPFRNLILLSIALARAEAFGAGHVYAGLQIHDEYGYWDTTATFVDALNGVAAQNRLHRIAILAPLSDLSKHQEIELAKELGKVEMLRSTLTCYDPNVQEESCGVCPSCSERIANFAKSKIVDPIPYAIPLKWDELFARFKG